MATMKFEEALRKLEKIVEMLEKGELSLEEALARYEEAVKLAKFCMEKLNAAERRINILVNTEDGKLVRKPFDEDRIDV